MRFGAQYPYAFGILSERPLIHANEVSIDAWTETIPRPRYCNRRGSCRSSCRALTSAGNTTEAEPSDASRPRRTTRTRSRLSRPCAGPALGGRAWAAALQEQLQLLSWLR